MPLDERPVATAVRTLLAAGFLVTGSHRRPRYIVIDCERHEMLGVLCRYTVAISGAEEFAEDERADILAHANPDGRGVAFVAAEPGHGQISWDDFLDALGGGVPSWRALADSYPETFLTLARNQLPEGTEGEAWRLFEEAAADGLEYLLGRRVQRLGGRRRGLTVSDMIAQMPNRDLLVVDAKAARGGFNASWPAMRPLGEYVLRQVQRQQGQNRVFGALMISSDFEQDSESLRELSLRFNAEFRAPVAFMSAGTLISAVEVSRRSPQIRNAVRWNQVFAGGLVEPGLLAREIADAAQERYLPQGS